MNESFNTWWNSDDLLHDNPHLNGTPAFWAWEGWVAGQKAMREAVIKRCANDWYAAEIVGALPIEGEAHD